MASKSLSHGQLAKFMTSDAAAQMRVVHDAKYPNTDESRAQAKYYREAHDRVRIHHNRSQPPPWLPAEAAALRVQAGQSPKSRTRSRLHNNARAIDDHAAHFAGRPFTVLKGKRFKLVYGDVTIRVTPDFIVRERGMGKLVRLYCNGPEPSDETVKIICQTMFEAAVQDGWPAGQKMTPARVLFLDLHRGAAHKGAAMRSRMQTNIQAACLQVSAIWDAI